MANPLGAAIPVMWAGRLLRHLDNAKVFASVATRQWEGEIKRFGDSVRILTPSTVTVSTYTKYSTLSAPGQVRVDAVSLVIDQPRIARFLIDDIDMAQTNPKLFAEFIKRAAIDLAENIDDDLSTVLTAGVATVNQLSAATVGTGAGDADTYEILVDLGKVLDDANVPGSERWVIVPPFVRALLLKDDRFVSFGTPQNMQALRSGTLGANAGGNPHPSNGRIGEAAGFTLYMSNNLQSSSTRRTVVAGHPSGFAYAEQLRKAETRRRDDSMGDEYRVLFLYGRKVLAANRLASVELTPA